VEVFSCLFGVARMSFIVKLVLVVAVVGRLKVWRSQLPSARVWQNTQAWGGDFMPDSSVSCTNVANTVSKLKSCCGVSLCGSCDVERVLFTRSATSADRCGRVRGIKDASPIAVRLCEEGLGLGGACIIPIAARLCEGGLGLGGACLIFRSAVALEVKSARAVCAGRSMCSIGLG
jgi:hypothetical protein